MTSLLQLAFPSPFFVDFICQPFYDQLIRRRRDGRRLGSICERYVGLTEKECKEDFALDLYFWSNEKKGALIYVRTYKECINGWKFWPRKTGHLTSSSRTRAWNVLAITNWWMKGTCLAFRNHAGCHSCWKNSFALEKKSSNQKHSSILVLAPVSPKSQNVFTNFSK